MPLSASFGHLDLGGFTLLEALESRHTLDYPVADSVRSKTRMTSHITAATCDCIDTIVYDNRALSADLERGDPQCPAETDTVQRCAMEDCNGMPTALQGLKSGRGFIASIDEEAPPTQGFVAMGDDLMSSRQLEHQGRGSDMHDHVPSKARAW